MLRRGLTSVWRIKRSICATVIFAIFCDLDQPNKEYQNTDFMIRINLISGPRNISTALMYSFAQRADTLVLDEPYYAVYLISSGAQHPGRDEVIARLPHQEEAVDARIFREVPGYKILFIKNMAHHIELLREETKEGLINVFLIRDPRQVIASYSRVIEAPVMRDLGIEYQHILFTKMMKGGGTPPVVLDSGLLLSDPESVLRQLCNTINIDYTPEMLAWPEGPKPYDGVWAHYWYRNVHRSQGFAKPTGSSPSIPGKLEVLCREATAYYKKLLPFAIIP